jgi:Na+-translocating ferredoxin:NAD+ oxidoreductase subunit D
LSSKKTINTIYKIHEKVSTFKKKEIGGKNKLSELMKVTSSPHIRSKNSTSGIMFLVILALLPTSIFGVWNFGIKALLIICITVSTTVLTELLYQIFMKQKTTISDLSAVVTGLLLALNLPSTIPWWVCVIGGVFAILVIKMLFGGIGQNFMNPALGARAFLIISFTPLMTNFEYDGVSSATPLAMLKAGSDVNVMDMVMGSIPGTIGETSMIAIVLGACLLILTGVIDLRIPGTYIVSFAIFLGLFGENGFNFTYISAHLAGGGLMLGAFFMATDYVTRPITKKGQYLFGLFLGILTGIFRVFGPSAEGVSYAIIIGNLIVPLIEKITLPKPFGKGGEKI